MTITTKLHSLFCGKLVGADQFGNRYYTLKKEAKKGRTKRWVIYQGRAEPSKVPAQWHGWLHYTTDVPPTERTVTHYGWEASPLPNLTGTKGAYLPPGHLAKGGQRDAATSDYEAWKP